MGLVARLVVAVLIAVAVAAPARAGSSRRPAPDVPPGRQVVVELAVFDAITRIAVAGAGVEVGDRVVARTDDHGRARLRLADGAALRVIARGYAGSRAVVRRDGDGRAMLRLFLLPALQAARDATRAPAATPSQPRPPRRA